LNVEKALENERMRAQLKNVENEMKVKDEDN
jgi:hypothetical protein